MNENSDSKIITPEELDQARDFVRRRDKFAQIIGVMTIQYDSEKAHFRQQIELANREEQEYMSTIARRLGVDPNNEYSLDYKTGEIKEK